MKVNRKHTFGFIALIVAFLVWIGVGLAFSIASWFEPAPPNSLKIDAIEEIAVTAGLLNVALPLAILLTLLGFVLAKKQTIPIILPILSVILLAILAFGSISWWSFMDAAHGTDISLTRNHLWWGR